MRSAKVMFGEALAGIISEMENGYFFTYDADYLKADDARPVSLSLPLREQPFKSTTLFPFFDGLIPEGWLLDVVEKNWKLNPRDRMGLLMVACKDCVGAVSIYPMEDDHG